MNTVAETQVATGTKVVQARNVSKIFKREAFEVKALDDVSIDIATGEFLALLDNDDELTPDALFEVAKAINASPKADFLYSDEDKIEEDGQYSDHYFKPDWSPEHLQSVMYLLHLIVIRKELFYRYGKTYLQTLGEQD